MTQTVTDLDGAVRAFYAELDANDQGVFARRLGAGAVFAFNDVDPVTGVDEIAAFVGAWKSNFTSVTHEIVGIAADPATGTAGVELVVTYVFPDSRQVKVNGCSFLDVADDRITGWRVYVDTSRLV